ncbi:MAG: sporulation protein YqfC [Clostridia bacterium]|nr:sporulation protein YqfC [Clostridia bacterium]
MASGRGATRVRGRLARLYAALEIPGDLVLDLARVSVLGAAQALVENHRGLLEYRPEAVAIAVSGGTVRIEGEELEIGVVTPEEVTVVGRLRRIEFERG